jgi:hypothetical protein
MRKYICDFCDSEIKHNIPPTNYRTTATGVTFVSKEPYSHYDFLVTNKNKTLQIEICFYKNNDHSDICIDCARYLCGKV